MDGGGEAAAAGRSALNVRLAGPADVPAIARFYRSLSPDSRLMRFFMATRDDPALARAAQFDPSGSVVVVAVVPDATGERVVAEARYALDDEQHEFGLAVLDDHQRRGLGSLLLEKLRQNARGRGIERLRALVRTDNQPMLRMLAMIGCAIVEPAAGGEVTVEVSTAPGMPGWPADHRRPRVVIEARTWWPTAEVTALRRAGYQVRQCQGPSAQTERPCPLLTGGECRLVAEADVVACLLPESDTDCVTVAETHRRQRPDRLTRRSGEDVVAEVRSLLAATHP